MDPAAGALQVAPLAREASFGGAPNLGGEAASPALASGELNQPWETEDFPLDVIFFVESRTGPAPENQPKSGVDDILGLWCVYVNSEGSTEIARTSLTGEILQEIRLVTETPWQEMFAVGFARDLEDRIVLICTDYGGVTEGEAAAFAFRFTEPEVGAKDVAVECIPLDGPQSLSSAFLVEDTWFWLSHYGYAHGAVNLYRLAGLETRNAAGLVGSVQVGSIPLVGINHKAGRYRGRASYDAERDLLAFAAEGTLEFVQCDRTSGLTAVSGYRLRDGIKESPACAFVGDRFIVIGVDRLTGHFLDPASIWNEPVERWIKSGER